MYITMRQYRVQPGQIEEVARRVDDDWLGKLHEMPGFISYHVFKAQEDHLISVSTFLDEKTGQEAAEASSEWVGEYLRDIKVEFVEMRQGPVLVHGGA
ncbi:MAG: antibiotic biosynthesis monooxygenase [Candidatus Dormiibacterota bacterium]